jgi:hypothetical protein
LVGSAAAPILYDLGEQAMQVSEQDARAVQLLVRFEKEAPGDALVAQAQTIRAQMVVCKEPQLALADCITFLWKHGRLFALAGSTCTAPERQRDALERLLGSE